MSGERGGQGMLEEPRPIQRFGKFSSNQFRTERPKCGGAHIAFVVFCYSFLFPQLKTKMIPWAFRGTIGWTRFLQKRMARKFHPPIWHALASTLPGLDPLWLLLVGIYKRAKRKDKKGIPGPHHGANLQTGYDGVAAAPAEMPRKPGRQGWDWGVNIKTARNFLSSPQKLELFLKKIAQTRSFYLC